MLETVVEDENFASEFFQREARSRRPIRVADDRHAVRDQTLREQQRLVARRARVRRDARAV